MLRTCYDRGDAEGQVQHAHDEGLAPELSPRQLNRRHYAKHCVDGDRHQSQQQCQFHLIMARHRIS